MSFVLGQKMRDGLSEFDGYVNIDYKNEYRDRTPREWYEFFTQFVNEAEFNWALTEEDE